MLHTITAGVLLATSLAGAPATAWHGAPPPTDKMIIGVVAANGSGCSGKSANVQVSPDNTAFTVTYSDFTAQTGPDAKPTDYRKNCQLALDVHVPSGYTYAVAGADYRGFGHLEEGATGSETAFYYFQGESHSTRIPHNFKGWMDNDWQQTDKVEVGSFSFLPCGEQRYLNVNVELRVNPGWSSRKATSFLSMDSSDGNLDTVYHVAWQKC
ncbi:hypothetical protein ACWT_5484 [Actinoplanes sp. SE50]|uniref:DUF4360 domain-containing protein n=1 Tax=unclassified Actinoplanes TaxID=2626549 RepID=UPI00023EC9E9|nr:MULTISPECIES: DUF4360 domain-containing protein [unclassified Actinoplanes]AEV86501.1 hypothetical protein ACPL_5614 [Actinoplanes sp. SE50/110]ATO84899.1 hypothetical protein ACWT_5484 [Actinoplanes sp. SE50]SLM02308.1 uncharacterized protein ACSP50_5547 [Actinoplanes sp. SE50/110]